AREPARLDAIVELVTRWLTRWNGATLRDSSIGPALIEELIVAPSRVLREVDGALDGYLTWVEELANTWMLDRTPVVAVHNDLTMTNVLVDGPAIGVIDWEQAAATGLPGTDLWYSLVDAVARAH